VRASACSQCTIGFRPESTLALRIRTGLRLFILAKYNTAALARHPQHLRNPKRGDSTNYASAQQPTERRSWNSTSKDSQTKSTCSGRTLSKKSGNSTSKDSQSKSTYGRTLSKKCGNSASMDSQSKSTYGRTLSKKWVNSTREDSQSKSTYGRHCRRSVETPQARTPSPSLLVRDRRCRRSVETPQARAPSPSLLTDDAVEEVWNLRRQGLRVQVYLFGTDIPDAFHQVSPNNSERRFAVVYLRGVYWQRKRYVSDLSVPIR
jgi:hypothetical protein